MFMRFVLLFERTRLVANTFFERHLDLLQHVPKGSRWPIPSPLCEALSQYPVNCWAANSSATDRNWLLSLTTRSFITYKKGPFPATNVSVKSKLQHPPGQSPGHLTFWKFKIHFGPPNPGQNAVQMPHTSVHSSDQMPLPRGHFTGSWQAHKWQKDDRTKSLQLSNKIFINTANNSHSI